MQDTNFKVTRVPGNGIDTDDLTTLIKTNFAPIAYGTPTGSIVAHLGTTDVTGWIICNGVTRTNNGDSRYNALNIMGIGTGGGGTSNYTPPNLTNKFLYGNSTTIGTTGGSATVALALTNIPSHQHTGTTNNGVSNTTISDPEHSHKLFNTGNNYARTGGGQRDVVPDKDAEISTPAQTSSNLNTLSSSTGITITDPGHTHTFTTSLVGSGTAFSILPSYYTVNYLLKI
jgi:microcystin-dependent protein